jgi:hypothetical protein
MLWLTTRSLQHHQLRLNVPSDSVASSQLIYCTFLAQHSLTRFSAYAMPAYAPPEAQESEVQ